MKSSLLGALCASIFSVITMPSNAALISALGGQAVYDTDFDITWLANANAGAGSAYDDGISASDGLMTWDSANAWAANISVGGVTGWRLPTSLNPNGTGPCGGINCFGSEMGHLFYNELDGNYTESILSSSDPDLLLFSNIQSGLYWSSTTAAIPDTQLAWGFYFDFTTLSGYQVRGDKSDTFAAWAVHDGDVFNAAVPLPAAFWLFVSGLLGLIGISRRKRAFLSYSDGPSGPF